MQSPEGSALFVRVSFSLFAAAAYKGISVPRPFRGGRGQVEAKTTAVHKPAADDPEPEPIVPENRAP